MSSSHVGLFPENATLENSSSRGKLVIKLHDYDGCMGQLARLLNPIFFSYLKGKPTSSNMAKLFTKFLAGPYGVILQAQAKDPAVQKILTVNASIRQNIPRDLINRINHFYQNSDVNFDDGSALFFNVLFAEFLAKHVSEKISADIRSTVDIWHKQRMGTEFKNAEKYGYFAKPFWDAEPQLTVLLDAFQNLSASDEAFSEKFKLIMISLMIHSIMLGYPDYDEYEFELYDDMDFIHKALSLLPPITLPKKAVLNIYSFDLNQEKPSEVIKTVVTQEPELVASIKGTGELREDFVKDLAVLYKLMKANGLTAVDSQLDEALLKKALGLYADYLNSKNQQQVVSSSASNQYSATSSALYKQKENEEKKTKHTEKSATMTKSNSCNNIASLGGK